MILLQLIKQSRLHGSPLRFTKTNATLKAEVTNISFDLQKSVRRSRWIESLNIASPLNLNFHIETLRAILRCNASQNARKTSQVASEERVSH